MNDALLWLARVRAAELEEILTITNGLVGNVLEIGGGTGAQAAALQRRGVTITSVDLATSNYRDARVFPLIEYDGLHLPFEDETFDTLFSSNVLEHVSKLELFQAEMMRVLKPDGCAVHVMPSHTWRIWSILTHYISLLQKLPRIFAPLSGAEPSDLRASSPRIMRALIPARHGERGNVVTEILYFRPGWWRKQFEQAGWIVEAVQPIPFFYTGHMVLRGRLDLPMRRKLACILGSASTCVVVRKPRRVDCGVLPSDRCRG